MPNQVAVKFDQPNQRYELSSLVPALVSATSNSYSYLVDPVTHQLERQYAYYVASDIQHTLFDLVAPDSAVYAYPAFTFAATTGATADNTLSNGLVGYWPFDDLANPGYSPLDPQGTNIDMQPSGSIAGAAGLPTALGLSGNGLWLNQGTATGQAAPMAGTDSAFGSLERVKRSASRRGPNSASSSNEQVLMEKRASSTGPGWTLVKLANDGTFGLEISRYGSAFPDGVLAVDLSASLNLSAGCVAPGDRHRYDDDCEQRFGNDQPKPMARRSEIAGGNVPGSAASRREVWRQPASPPFTFNCGKHVQPLHAGRWIWSSRVWLNGHESDRRVG